MLNLNNYTDTIPDYRCNLQVSNENGGFSSYQSDYPFRMITKKGSIISSLYSLTNASADINYLYLKNIFEKPVNEKFKIYFIDIINKKILFEDFFISNKTNEMKIDKKFIKPEIHLITSNYIGIPMFISMQGNHISFEHTHPPHEYILGPERFETINKLKDEINEIIYKANS